MHSPARRMSAVVGGAAAILFALGAASCSLDVSDTEAGVAGAVPKGCAAVDVAASPEKLRLLTTIAQRFNASAAEGDDCAFARVYEAASGEAAQRLADGWRSGASLEHRAPCAR